MEDKNKVTVSITNRTIVKVILWITAAFVTYHFIAKISHVLTLIFAALFLALALNPGVKSISNRLHIKSRVRATAVAYLIAVALLIGFFALITPPLVRQTRDFISDVPTTVQNFQNNDTSVSRAVKRYHLDQKLTEGARDFTSNYSGFGNKIFDTSRRVGEAIASFFVVLVLTFMMLVEGPRWMQTYLKALPKKRREHQHELAQKMYKSVSNFVNGQVLLAMIAGFFAFCALEIAGHILDVPTNAAALAGIVTVFGIIPLFGNPTAATIVVLASLLNSVTLAIVMAIYFIIYFFIENHTFQPYLQSRITNLSPLTVFVAALVGVAFGGILGAIVAIPAASAIKILIEDHFAHRKIGSET